jgi:septum formation protein
MLILASASPRRREILARAGVACEVVPAEIDERSRPGEAPEALAERLAREKALCVARRVGPRPPRLVLGSDTIVVLDGEVLGKPRDPAHAEALLARLAGRTHRVITGVALARSESLDLASLTVASRVTMRAAGADEIRRYVASGEPLDKAGAYALQGEGRRLVAAVEGSESNVIGLPLEETLGLLRAAGGA